MKRHTKFALLACCVAVIPLLSAKATTFQVQVGAGGLKFTAAEFNHSTRRHGRMDLGR
jgi:hypothetical protein